MERSTIYLEPRLKRQLKEAALARGTAEALIIREALAAYLDKAPRRRVKPVGRSRDGGVAHRVDEALQELGFGRR